MAAIKQLPLEQQGPLIDAERNYMHGMAEQSDANINRLEQMRQTWALEDIADALNHR